MTLYVHVAGRLGHSAELSYVGPNQTPKCEISLAASEYDKDAPNKQRTRWYKCTLWGNRGISLSPYLKKGMPVTVHGKHVIRHYTRKDGTDGLSEEIEIIGIDPQGSSKDSNTQEAADDATPPDPPAAQATQPPAAAPFNDYIPF